MQWDRERGDVGDFFCPVRYSVSFPLASIFAPSETPIPRSFQQQSEQTFFTPLSRTNYAQFKQETDARNEYNYLSMFLLLLLGVKILFISSSSLCVYITYREWRRPILKSDSDHERSFTKRDVRENAEIGIGRSENPLQAINRKLIHTPVFLPLSL